MTVYCREDDSAPEPGRYARVVDNKVVEVVDLLDNPCYFYSSELPGTWIKPREEDMDNAVDHAIFDEGDSTFILPEVIFPSEESVDPLDQLRALLIQYPDLLQRLLDETQEQAPEPIRETTIPKTQAASSGKK